MESLRHEVEAKFRELAGLDTFTDLEDPLASIEGCVRRRHARCERNPRAREAHKERRVSTSSKMRAILRCFTPKVIAQKVLRRR